MRDNQSLSKEEPNFGIESQIDTGIVSLIGVLSVYAVSWLTGDRRQGSGPGPTILSPEFLAMLRNRLKTTPEDSKVWSAKKGASVIAITASKLSYDTRQSGVAFNCCRSCFGPYFGDAFGEHY